MSNFHLPAEWAPHDAVWIGFPSADDLWLDDLEPAQAEVAAFARAVRADGAGERVILVAADRAAAEAASALAGAAAEIIIEPFGDIWLRDTGPIIVHDSLGKRTALRHRFNGWGGKYDLPHDDMIGAQLAARAGFPLVERDWIFEGGAIDVDGTGLAVTTEQCLLNPNRNPALTRADIEARLLADLGVTRRPEPRANVGPQIGCGIRVLERLSACDDLAQLASAGVGAVAISTPALPQISVRVAPGSTAWTRMPVFANSVRSVMLRFSMKAFVLP